MNPSIKFPDHVVSESDKKIWTEAFNAGIMHACSEIKKTVYVFQKDKPYTQEEEDEIHADRSEAARHDAEVDAAQEESERNQPAHD